MFQKDSETYAGRENNESMDKFLRGTVTDALTMSTPCFLGGTTGVVFVEGEQWRDQRRFTLHVLRDFGMGKGIMQEQVGKLPLYCFRGEISSTVRG